MKISDLKNIIDIRVDRDISFENVGLNTSEPNQKIITFIDNPKYIKNISKDIVAVITTEELSKKIDENLGLAVSKKPRIDYFKLVNNINSIKNEKKNPTTIGYKCKISNLASISNYNVTIGNNVIIEEFVVIRENTIIGDNVIIRSGSKVGTEGFEYKVLDDYIMSVIHAGKVHIEDDVEIKSNVCIDKAVYSWDKTLIGKNTKIDNLVYIAHGAKIGSNCLIIGGSVIGGRSIIGEKSKVGFGTIISNALKIGRKSRVRLGGVVTKDLKEFSDVSGNFAINHKKNIENIKKIR